MESTWQPNELLGCWLNPSRSKIVWVLLGGPKAYLCLSIWRRITSLHLRACAVVYWFMLYLGACAVVSCIGFVVALEIRTKKLYLIRTSVFTPLESRLLWVLCVWVKFSKILVNLYFSHFLIFTYSFGAPKNSSFPSIVFSGWPLGYEPHGLKLMKKSYLYFFTSEYAEMFPELDSELPAFRSTFFRPWLPSLKSQCLRNKRLSLYLLVNGKFDSSSSSINFSSIFACIWITTNFLYGAILMSYIRELQSRTKNCVGLLYLVSTISISIFVVIALGLVRIQATVSATFFG